MIETAVPVLYLDLDGTVRQGKDDALGRFVNGPDDVVVFPEAVEMMRRWKAAGGRIIGVSNQGGIALGGAPSRAWGRAVADSRETPASASPLPCGWPGGPARAIDRLVAEATRRADAAVIQYGADIAAAAGDPDLTALAERRCHTEIDAIEDALDTALAALDRTQPKETHV